MTEETKNVTRYYAHRIDGDLYNVTCREDMTCEEMTWKGLDALLQSALRFVPPRKLPDHIREVMVVNERRAEGELPNILYRLSRTQRLANMVRPSSATRERIDYEEGEPPPPTESQQLLEGLRGRWLPTMIRLSKKKSR